MGLNMKLLSAFYYIVSISFIFLACAAPDKKLGIENGYCKEDNTCNNDDLVCFDDICIENKCKTINCLDNWLSCNPKDGRCTILKDGYCLQDSDCILDSEEICSGKHECVSKCISKTCDELSVECGIRDDGCGNHLDCGTCDIGDGEYCNKGVCDIKDCVPKTCDDFLMKCGIIDDGCGNNLDCDNCDIGEYCNAGECELKDCIPKTCDDFLMKCGIIDDGCGNNLDCDNCDTGEYCNAGKCEFKDCTPKTCGELSRECGIINDGCGNELSCGSCGAGEYCDYGKCKTSISDGELGAVCNEDLPCNEDYLCLGADGDTHCYQPCNDVSTPCIQENYICQDIGNPDIGWICLLDPVGDVPIGGDCYTEGCVEEAICLRSEDEQNICYERCNGDDDICFISGYTCIDLTSFEIGWICVPPQ